ncbi:MAG TPA: carboxypeptidase-like regulatory domain-containing protein, partial [Bryobacteraceae bacterium]|nr:carboxypeptidase-like regulatory domain-containing protein [Bryobacteraceae bacterium]
MKTLKGFNASACLLFLATAFCLHAQNFRGRVQGTITDSSNAAVAGATVTLKNVNTGVPAVRQTNESGHYLFDLVDPGSYEVSVEYAGFSKFVQQNITLQSRGDITVDAMLKTGDVRESVTVSAEASMVQFNTAKLETTVDSKLTSNVPQIYRSPFLLAQLDPAVERNDGNGEYQPYHSWG